MCSRLCLCVCLSALVCCDFPIIVSFVVDCRKRTSSDIELKISEPASCFLSVYLCVCFFSNFGSLLGYLVCCVASEKIDLTPPNNSTRKTNDRNIAEKVGMYEGNQQYTGSGVKGEGEECIRPMRTHLAKKNNKWSKTHNAVRDEK